MCCIISIKYCTCKINSLSPQVTAGMREESDRRGRERAAKVKEAMQHAWKGYEQYAWGADELAPRGKKPKQSWGGMGVTLVDSLGEGEFCFLVLEVQDFCGSEGLFLFATYGSVFVSIKMGVTLVDSLR